MVFDQVLHLLSGARAVPGHPADAYSRCFARGATAFGQTPPCTPFAYAGGLSSLQSTDIGKLYHKGVLLALILMGRLFVPGVPKNARQARAVIKFVAELLDVFERNRIILRPCNKIGRNACIVTTNCWPAAQRAARRLPDDVMFD